MTDTFLARFNMVGYLFLAGSDIQVCNPWFGCGMSAFVGLEENSGKIS